MAIESRNPATGDLVQVYEPLDDRQIEAALDTAWQAFKANRGTPMSDRTDWMCTAADILDNEKERFGALVTEEMGKPISQAISEIEKCALVCRHYAEHASAMLGDETIETGASRSFVRHLPLGPVLAVMPWNFPFWQVFRFAAPALMAGNVGLLKHASNVPRTAQTIEDVFKRSGFPEGAFQTLLVGANKVEKILNDDRVRAATLTGSEAAGASVAAIAGSKIKPTVLELGGSDPFIVMPSADLDHAVANAVTARTMNAGQSCIAAKRFIVHSDVYRAFTDRFVDRMSNLAVGDPMNKSVEMGPLAMEQTRDDLSAQVQRSIDAGAEVLTGAELLSGPGYYFSPGILANVTKEAPAYHEELFGPVASLFEVASLDEALELANNSRFGLGSAIYTEDQSDIDQAIDRLEAGNTFVNAVVASDPRLPFGGVKASGYGRELARDGILAFVNRKTVSIA